MGIGFHLDPDKEPVGRQALNAIWTPSKPRYPWFGTVRNGTQTDLAFVGGDRFTEEQEAALIELGRDIPTAPAMLVKRQALYNEIWRGGYDLPEVFHCECPTTGKIKADGKIQVIAPSGDVAWVHPDGWAARPYRTPAIYSMREQR